MPVFKIIEHMYEQWLLSSVLPINYFFLMPAKIFRINKT